MDDFFFLLFGKSELYIYAKKNADFGCFCKENNYLLAILVYYADSAKVSVCIDMYVFEK